MPANRKNMSPALYDSFIADYYDESPLVRQRTRDIAFYRDANEADARRWDFWRLEGPGFVWNYRVLPHVHTYVNIALRPPQQQGT